MDLIALGPGVIVLHILPLLSEKDIRALAAVETGLFALLADMRFKTCKVSNNIGFILDYLQPSTLLKVKDLRLNGTTAQHNLVFRTPNLRSVQRATVCCYITDNQRPAFAVFAKQLRGLTEEQDISDPEEIGSSLSSLPAGALTNLHALRIELTVPIDIDSRLGFARNLRIIQFLPSFSSGVTEEEKLDDYILFATDFQYLLENILNKNLLPSLRLVHTDLDQPTVANHLRLRIIILESVWTAAAAHGGWRLLAGRTSNKPLKAYPGAWGDWWTEHATDLYLSVEEVKLFSKWCDSNNRFPRFDEFVAGRIHIHFPIECEAVDKLFDNKIFGITLSLGSAPNLCNPVKIISTHTRAIDISLETYWGDVPTVQFGAQHFQHIEVLRIAGPTATPPETSLQYSNNIGAHILSTLSTKHWSSLRALSIPAYALQRTTPEENLGGSDHAACGIHVGGYELAWLAQCGTLESLHVTEWCACDECELEDDLSLVEGLRHLPQNVKFVSVTGYFCSPANVLNAWSERVVGEIKAVLRADVLVSTGELRFGPT